MAAGARPGRRRARSSATARGWRARRRARRAVRGGQGRRLRPRRRGRRARRAGGRREPGSPSPPRPRPRRCARRASTGRVLVMGALVARGAHRARCARGPTWSPGARASSPRSRRTRTARGAGVHVKLDTGMGRLGTRDPAEATRGRRGGRRRAGPAARRRDDALRHRRRRPRLRARAARRFPPWAEALRGAHAGAAPARRELRRHARDPRVAARPRALRHRRLRHGPVRRRPGGARARAGARAALLPRGGQARPRRARAPGYGRRFVAARADLDRHGAGRLRGRRAAGADERRATCSSAGAACRSSARCRWTTSPSTSGRRPAGGRRARWCCSAARAASACWPRSGRGGWARSTTRSRARSAPACRGSTHR